MLKMVFDIQHASMPESRFETRNYFPAVGALSTREAGLIRLIGKVYNQRNLEVCGI